MGGDTRIAGRAPDSGPDLMRLDVDTSSTSVINRPPIAGHDLPRKTLTTRRTATPPEILDGADVGVSPAHLWLAQAASTFGPSVTQRRIMVGVITARPRAAPVVPPSQLSEETALRRWPLPTRPQDHVHLRPDLRAVRPDVLRPGPHGGHSSAVRLETIQHVGMAFETRRRQRATPPSAVL